jgi:hypothetical protein
LTAALGPRLPVRPVAAGAPANGGVAWAAALSTARGALLLDLVMSIAGAAGEELAADAFSSEAPSSISGSINSADDNNNVGISPESEGAFGIDVLEGGGGELGGEAGEASVCESSSTPYASKSSSGFVRPVDGVAGGDPAAVDAGGRASPISDAVPFNPKGSSTGRSAKGSRAGREAASIVFEPESGDQS